MFNLQFNKLPTAPLNNARWNILDSIFDLNPECQLNCRIENEHQKLTLISFSGHFTPKGL